MEADSTTNNSKVIDGSSDGQGPCLPFNPCPGNYKLFKDFLQNNNEKNIESQIVEKLQNFGLLPSNITCLSNTPECKMICKAARVIDRVQWACEACGKRQAIRDGSFFFRLQGSLAQTLQIALAWCEDADCNVVAEYFGIKSKVANQIYDKLDEFAIKEYNKTKLGGPNSVVLAEMYPECLNRLSPDTTDQPHVHRILMLADTKHIPTYYRLYVIREETKKMNEYNRTQALKSQIECKVSNSMVPESTLVVGGTVPAIDGAVTLQQLTQQCDNDMQHFLTSRIWKQALTLCAASRDLCATGTAPSVCAAAVQRYLDAALYRLRYGDGFYEHMLNVVAAEYTTTNRIN